LRQTIGKFESWVILLSGASRYLAGFLAGAVSALAMAPFDLVFVLLFTIPILIWLIEGACSEPTSNIFGKLWEGFKPGFFFGFGYFVCGLWWIGNALLVDADDFAWALPIAVLALPAVLAIFWGAATAVARLFWFGEVRRVFVLAACLALAEYLRGFVATGFPWNTLGYAGYFNTITMQSASVLGLYAMTPFVVLVSAFLMFVFPTIAKVSPKHHVMTLVCLALAVAHAGFGVWRLDSREDGKVEGVQLRLVQPAINQAEKFDRSKEAEIIQRYLDLSVTEKGGKKLSDVTHLLWPESAFPFLLTERRDALAAIASMLPEGTSLVTGAARAEEAGAADRKDLVFNSVYVVDHNGVIISAADKVHLVPFGEYLPFQELAESIGLQQVTQVQGGFTAGNSRKLLSTAIGPAFLPLICYEIIFSDAVWQGEKRPGWIVNLTNDAWYGITPGPYQHERQAVVRAVEEGLPLARVANSGISGVYSAYGEPISTLPLGTRGIIDAELPSAAPKTMFSVNGNLHFWICFVLFFSIGLIPRIKTKV